MTQTRHRDDRSGAADDAADMPAERPITPSDWHDDARRRDAGHDEMQASVWRWLLDNPIMPARPEPVHDFQSEWKVLNTECEKPFTKRGRILSFGDVVQTYGRRKYREHKDMEYAFGVFEIKPRIASVGAVIRQCHAMDFTIRPCLSPNIWDIKLWIVAVVPSTDPKLKLLEEVYDGIVMPWDMAAGKPAR